MISPLPPTWQDHRPYHLLRESLLTGIAVVVPAILTLYLLKLVVGFFVDIATPLASFLLYLWPGVEASYVILDLGLVVLLAVMTLAVGFVAHFHAGERAITYVDGAVMRLPGIGTVYESLRQLSDAMLASDQQSFQAVKLVEFPDADTYALGFLITDTPPAISSAVGDDLHTVFVPLAPNPVMAGFLLHVSDDRMVDIALSVEEGISAIVSLGAAEADTYPHEGISNSHR